MGYFDYITIELARDSLMAVVATCARIQLKEGELELPNDERITFVKEISIRAIKKSRDTENFSNMALMNAIIKHYGDLNKELLTIEEEYEN